MHVKKWKTEATCFSFQYLFPDAVDKSADGSEARTNASTGSIPPPDGEDSVSSDAYVKNMCQILITFIQRKSKFHGLD